LWDILAEGAFHKRFTARAKALQRGILTYKQSNIDIIILRDDRHSTLDEERFYAVGRIVGGIVTVRFTMRSNVIRIFGAGFWRKYRSYYLKGTAIDGGEE
jgi:uncharacterized DUF497 family protein